MDHPQSLATPISHPEGILNWSKAYQKEVFLLSGTSISTHFVTQSPTTTIHIPAVISQVHTIIAPITTSTTQMVNPLNQMQLIVAARYGPIVLLVPLHDFPQGDYLKYLQNSHDKEK